MNGEVDIVIVVIGILLALVATTAFNLAFVFQKRGLNQASAKGIEIETDKGLKHLIKTFIWLFKNKFWLLGVIIGGGGWIPYVISIGLVGIVVSEPVMATGLIVFVIAATRMLKERVGPLEYVAIGMLTVSPVLIAFAGTSDVAIDFYTFVPAFIIFIVLSVPISIISLIIAKKKKGTSAEGLFTMLGGAILFALGGTATNIWVQALLQASSTINWYVLFELVFGIFWYFTSGSYLHLWMFLGFWMMVVFSISSIPFYQGGIQKGKLLIMYPILDSIALLLPIFAGLLVFQQTFTNYVLFFIAIVLIIAATLILGKYQLAFESFEIKNKNDK